MRRANRKRTRWNGTSNVYHLPKRKRSSTQPVPRHPSLPTFVIEHWPNFIMRNVQKGQQGRFGVTVVSATDDRYKGYYNGFSMAERRATGPILRAARKAGLLGSPKECSICGVVQSLDAPLRMEWHVEDYREPLNLYAICHSCHRTLHARFEQPRRWERLIARNSDKKWVQKLTMDAASKGRPFDETYPR